MDVQGSAHTRLALLAATEPGIAESQIFRLALHHAAAELRAVAGAVHMRGPTSALRLVCSAGLPPASAERWDIVMEDGPAVPAGAVREGRRTWVPARADDTAGVPASPWPGTGLASVPFFSGDRAVGAITLLTGDRGEPSAREWDYLRAVAAWTEQRIRQAPPRTQPAQESQEAQEVLAGDRLRQALRGVPIGTWDWDLRTGHLEWADAAVAIYGALPADYEPRMENWMRAAHPDDLPSAMAAAERAIRDRTGYETEYRMRRPDGSYGWNQARGSVVCDENGDPVRMVGVVWDSSESRSARDALARALRMMSDGFVLLDDAGRIVFVNLEAERIFGAQEQELLGRLLWELPAVQGVPDLEPRCRQAATAAAAPVSFDVWLSPDQCHRLRLVPGPSGLTVYLTDVTEKRRREAERAAARRAAAERSARIAELTAALAKATTSSDVVDAVAQRVLPPLGASGLAMITVVGGRWHVLGAVGYPAPMLDTLDGLRIEPYDPAGEALLTGAPLFIPSAEEFARRYPRRAHLPGVAGKQAWAFLPLTVSGRTFSVCVVSFDKPRRLAHDEQTLLTTISALVAHALERARLYDAEHTRSQELQRALLPRELPRLPECTVAARFLAATQDVGGDWYDVIPLSGGRVALVAGDVMGHGLSEAATMGRLRTAVHTLADLELPPDELMGRLNQIVGGLGGDSYATCLYAVHDATTGVCTLTLAGHPPPAVVEPDGRVHFPELSPDPPLGVAQPPFRASELKVRDGTLLALYTDGLVESGGREIGQGMADLAELLRTAGRDDLERLCDLVTSKLLPDEQPTAPDDAVLLLARLHTLSGDRMAAWQLPDDPRAAGQAREHVRDQLPRWGLDELVMTTELIVSELVGNVVRHARGPARLRLLHTRPAGLVCEVSDGSLTTPRIRRASAMDEGGRGLQLVAALCQRWGARYTATGKCIWAEQALSGEGRELPWEPAAGAGF
ncbi:SpoIIE family protein phosphatase [Streptomyces sp. NPDC020996]|uniref:SpoIIE family protein phosphatase n=1 Tax=Streptomyces sp. NPDC020996 TaxID=3154791 RepID=UPI00340215DE